MISTDLKGISRLFVSFLLLIIIAPLIHADNSEPIQTDNIFCPVMPDMKAIPEIFTDYKGKRVYFCCVNCRAAFGKDPEKYIPRLPQFEGTLLQAGIDHHNHEHEITLAKLIKPMGITTLSLLALTGFGGLFRRKLPKPLLKWHKRLGIITLISALIHATLVIIVH